MSKQEGDTMISGAISRSITIFAALAILSGCAASSEAPASESSKTTLTVGVIPIIDVAPLYLGVKKGFFEEEGLEIEYETVQSGAASAAAVVSGGEQIGFSAPTPLLTGTLKGLPVKVIANAASTAENANAIVVPTSSPIQDVLSLNGKTVGVNALGAADELYLRAAIDQEGGDSTSIEFVAVPFPNMVASLKSGSIAAGSLGQPFLSAAASDIRQILTDPQRLVIGQDATLSVWFTSDAFMSENPKAVEAFVRAIKKSNTFANENPDEVKAIVGEYTDLTPEAIADATFPRFLPDLDTATFEKTAELMVKYGFVDKKPDAAALLPSSD